jgi:hypothetical protein
MSLKRIHLELARDHPEGSRDRGFEFAAPLDENGQLPGQALLAGAEG